MRKPLNFLVLCLAVVSLLLGPASAQQGGTGASSRRRRSNRAHYSDCADTVPTPSPTPGRPTTPGYPQPTSPAERQQDRFPEMQRPIFLSGKSGSRGWHPAAGIRGDRTRVQRRDPSRRATRTPRAASASNSGKMPSSYRMPASGVIPALAALVAAAGPAPWEALARGQASASAIWQVVRFALPWRATGPTSCLWWDAAPWTIRMSEGSSSTDSETWKEPPSAPPAWLLPRTPRRPTTRDSIPEEGEVGRCPEAVRDCREGVSTLRLRLV